MMASTVYAKKEHKESSKLAANQIKKATLNVAKGLSRVQVERVVAAAARNVNAYGQKEEGPSRWQERKEAKRQMYLMSTEKAVKLGVRKDNKTMKDGLRVGVHCQQIQCQKCFEEGHWTFECKNERAYVSRPSRTQQLQNPSLRQPFLEPCSCDPLPHTKAKVEAAPEQAFLSTSFATLEQSTGSRKSNPSALSNSSLRNRKRKRSSSSSSESPSSESPSKSDSESEMSSSSSEDPSSTTYSSSTMSSPSRTTSSSRKSSSQSSTDPPTPESDSENRPSDTPLDRTMLADPNTPAKGESAGLEDVQSKQQSQPLASPTTCSSEKQEPKIPEGGC